MALKDLFRPQRRLLRLEAELASARRELAALKAQNDSMRTGMRRCVSCQYRIESKQRQDERSG